MRKVKNDKGMFYKKVRWAKGLTQKEFAKKYGLSYGSVQNWEEGLRTPGAATNRLYEIINNEKEG